MKFDKDVTFTPIVRTIDIFDVLSVAGIIGVNIFSTLCLTKLIKK